MDKDAFLKLIKEKISNYQQEVEQIMNRNNSTFEKYKALSSLLGEDLDNIASVSLEEIEDILRQTVTDDDERKRETSFLKYTKSLLDLNQTKQTTYQLSDVQKSYLELFKGQVGELEETSKVAMKKQLEGASRITDKIKELRSLLGFIEDPKNKEYIIDDTLIQELLSSCTEEEQMAILFFILKYNQSLYHDKMSQQELIDRPRLNLEEVKELFDDFGYDFSELKNVDQDYLLSYGHINQIREILECLQKFHFPRFDLRRNGKKLVAILVNSDVQTIEDIVDYSHEKDISPQTLLLLVPALIKQTKQHTGQSGNFVGQSSSSITGRSEDYKKNIKFLEKIGFQISFIVKKCKELLIMSNAKLEANYQKFELYGFKVPTDEYGNLCHPALSCLMSNNFDEIVDQFIEISPKGHSYIRDNMSRVSTITSPHDLCFYNIYASYMDQNEVGDKLIPEGPFVNENHSELKLRGEITRYSGSGYEKIPYRGITEENKQEKTMTVDIDCLNKDEFDKAVEKHRGNEEELYDLVFNDNVILGLDTYIDKNDPLRYDFDGVLISKQKVLRIFNILKNEHLDSLEDSLFYAITYNSILNQDAIDRIKHIIKDRRK